MWSKSPFFLLRTRIKKHGRGLGLVVVLAGYVLSGWLLSWEPLLGFLPGAAGKKARCSAEAVLGILWELTDGAPQRYAHINVKHEDSRILVDLRTFGFFGGGGRS